MILTYRIHTFESLTLSLTRNIGPSVTVDVRYVGTLSRKQIGSFALNSVDYRSIKSGFGAGNESFEDAFATAPAQAVNRRC